MAGGWYWCLKHGRAERAGQCPEKDRLGPYDSAQEAANWQQQVESRNEAWDAEDRRWRDEPERG